MSCERGNVFTTVPTLYNFITDFILKISTNWIRQEVLRTSIRSYIRKEYNRLDNRCKTKLISISGRNMFDESFTFHSFKIDRKGSKAEHTKSTETDIYLMYNCLLFFYKTSIGYRAINNTKFNTFP